MKVANRDEIHHPSETGPRTGLPIIIHLLIFIDNLGETAGRDRG
jgi:hypothetical protein